MSTERLSIFNDPLDLNDFAPKARPSPAEIDQVAEGSKFKSREPKPLAQPQEHAVAPAAEGGRRAPRLYRTGRNATVSIKTTPAALEEFYRLADKAGLKVGETFERAVEALRRELDGA